METRGEFRIDPGCLETDAVGSELEVVIPYTEPSVTAAVLKRVPILTAGLNARVTLVAVHTLPYPLPFVCPTVAHAHLVEQLVELAGQCALPVNPQVVMARGREEGFRYALKPASTILVGTFKHLWRTGEEQLARSLARDGHKVALIHVE
ncbi:MAG: hypothetical protein ABSF62_13055 [Bryobacteraceae bacterium]|jgi:hypothetical protein